MYVLEIKFFRYKGVGLCNRAFTKINCFLYQFFPVHSPNFFDLLVHSTLDILHKLDFGTESVVVAEQRTAPEVRSLTRFFFFILFLGENLINGLSSERPWLGFAQRRD